MLLINLKDALLDMFFPPICVGCKKYTSRGKDFTSLCLNCFESIKINKLLQLSPQGKIATMGSYADPALREIILSLKYRGLTSVDSAIKALLKKYIDTSDFTKHLDVQNPIAIPVPLHKKKERERGFNQATLIAKRLGELTSIPVITNLVYRTRATGPQSSLGSDKAKRENIKGAFSVSKEPSKDLTIKTAIIVDDIYTSGATANEVIKTLRRAGFKKFIIFVLARA